MFWSLLKSFQVHVCFGEMQRLWSKRLIAVQETNQNQFSDGVSIDTNPLVLLDTDARRWADLFVADLSTKDPHNYKITYCRLLPYIYSVYHCLDNTPHLLHIILQHKDLWFLVDLKRRSKTPLEICIGNPLISYSFLFRPLL